jgi:hypothetical protein
MTMYRRSSTALAAVMAIILGVPAAAWAGEGGDDGHPHGWKDDGDGHPHGWNRGGNVSNEHYNVHYRNGDYTHYAGRGPYYPHYYPRYYPHYYPAYGCANCGKDHHHNNHNNDNDKLWIGLLGGGILGYGLNAYEHSKTTGQGSNAEATSAPPPPPQYANTAPANPCLQQREYNTKIMVGGKQVNGYGTACLQPDGSWRYGAAQPETF